MILTDLKVGAGYVNIKQRTSVLFQYASALLSIAKNEIAAFSLKEAFNFIEITSY